MRLVIVDLRSRAPEPLAATGPLWQLPTVVHNLVDTRTGY